MHQTPILRALSTIQKHGVRNLLMGGQACVLYGAAEFSRDLDITLLASPENLARLGNALADLLLVPYADAMLVKLPPGVDPVAVASVPAHRV